ncbi:hypothetical protein HK099_006483 [Clydaea vesicula]|uniref:PPM-type phosphatase domain-containing protein n=1 Tax=Clydaea vesicula TaxID=447962 RepID=A0AAD5XU91_9FUNG|nr:hypothetical protein HK099_006483 [Clydaea vesicula]
MQIKHALSTNLGGRSSQQDGYLVIENLYNQPSNFLFAIFDGHGSEGGKAANFAKLHLPELLTKYQKEFEANRCEALKLIFKTLNEMMVEDPSVDTYMSGTTLSILIIFNNKLIVANVGDSRVILGQNEGTTWKYTQLTNDHNCENKVECSRVVEKGARVDRLTAEENEDAGPLRIFKGSLPYPGLVVTRSLGDDVATKLGVLSEPEYYEKDINPTDKFVVVASDGVWDGLSNQEVLDITVKHLEDPVKISKLITKKSVSGMKKKHMDDNTTNIVILLG